MLLNTNNINARAFTYNFDFSFLSIQYADLFLTSIMQSNNGQRSSKFSFQSSTVHFLTYIRSASYTTTAPGWKLPYNYLSPPHDSSVPTAVLWVKSSDLC